MQGVPRDRVLHGVPRHWRCLTRSRSYRSTEGFATDYDTREACYECHERSTCEGCHGVSMPHPADFLPSHPVLVEEEGDEACNRCHEPADCDACHTRHAHPGLTDDEVRALRQKPVYTP